MTNQIEILSIIEKFKGVLSQEYNFLPVASENEINQFENKFEVKLPSDYKWFILNIANGIESEDKWNHNILERIDFQNFFYKEKEYNPSIPFNLKTKVRFYDKEDDENDDYPFEIIYDFDRKIFREGYLNGEITLAGYGCGTSAFLIINGSEYGNVWIDDYASNQEVYPEYCLEKNQKRLTFIDWIIVELKREIKISNKALETQAKLINESKIVKKGLIESLKNLFK